MRIEYSRLYQPVGCTDGYLERPSSVRPAGQYNLSYAMHILFYLCIYYVIQSLLKHDFQAMPLPKAQESEISKPPVLTMQWRWYGRVPVSLAFLLDPVLSLLCVTSLLAQSVHQKHEIAGLWLLTDRCCHKQHTFVLLSLHLGWYLS